MDDKNEKIDTSKIEKPSCLSSEVRFYGIAELVEMLGWSRHTVLKLFGDPEFPAVDFGKRKVVESHALIEYFSRRRTKKEERYWRMEAWHSQVCESENGTVDDILPVPYYFNSSCRRYRER